MEYISIPLTMVVTGIARYCDQSQKPHTKIIAQKDPAVAALWSFLFGMMEGAIMAITWESLRKKYDGPTAIVIYSPFLFWQLFG